MSDILSRFFQTFDQTKELASWQSVFGQPQTQGERTVIPVATTRFGFGFGLGTAPAEDTGAEATSEGPLGGGGGAGGNSRPVAIIELTPRQVSIRPILDYTLLVFSALITLLLGFCLWSRVAKTFLAHRSKPAS